MEKSGDNQPKLLIATKNEGKFKELVTLLELPNVTFLSLRDVEKEAEVVEDGESYEANAKIKADTYFELTKLPTLADDSGLEIDYLEGEPGILSSRYMGEDIDYDEKNSKILDMMSDSVPEERSARFICSLVLRCESGSYAANGVCEGKIAFEPRGKSGFGYDPLFIPKGHDLTFGQLPEDIKNRVSHRAIAARYLRDRIVALGLFGEVE